MAKHGSTISKVYVDIIYNFPDSLIGLESMMERNTHDVIVSGQEKFDKEAPPHPPPSLNCSHDGAEM